MREIADALAYLHGQGMLHRDLKAENVLIDRHGRAKLADLGVAQVDALLEDTEAKAVDMGLQDVAFIAPENLANVKEGSLRQSSKATDIYALGLVFWQMISGGQAPTPWNALMADKGGHGLDEGRPAHADTRALSATDTRADPVLLAAEASHARRHFRAAAATAQHGAEAAS